MKQISDPKPGQLYRIEWCIEELNMEGEEVGTYTLFEENGETYFDFKIDGEKMIYRFELHHILSVNEYNYDRRSRL